MSTQQNHLSQLMNEQACLKHLFSPGVQSTLFSRVVVEFVIAYGKTADAYLPFIGAARQKCYDDQLAQGVSVEKANQAAFTAQLNEFLKIPFPPFPGLLVQPPDAPTALCTPPLQEGIEQDPQNGQEQPK